ncbi:phox (PX) domain protein, partial [Trifolium medium]|nr:phox (PX) domain protein [Trifolium medium]
MKKEFPMKNLPSPPPKKILRIKSEALLEERRCLLENWMKKLLSDIAVSRSAPAAIFLELEAAARASFHDADQHISDEQTASSTTPSHMIQDNSLGFVKAASVSGDDTLSEVSELGTPRHGKDKCSEHIVDNLTSEHDLINPTETSVGPAASSKDFIYEDNNTGMVAENSGDAIAIRLDGADYTPANAHVKRLSTESIGNDLSSVRNTETSSSAVSTLLQDVSHDLPGSRV